MAAPTVICNSGHNEDALKGMTQRSGYPTQLTFSSVILHFAFCILHLLSASFIKLLINPTESYKLIVTAFLFNAVFGENNNS